MGCRADCSKRVFELRVFLEETVLMCQERVTKPQDYLCKNELDIVIIGGWRFSEPESAVHTLSNSDTGGSECT